MVLAVGFFLLEWTEGDGLRASSFRVIPGGGEINYDIL
jgi:hypothetical protein